MRITQVLGNSKFGGGVWVVLWLSQALRENGHEVIIIAESESVAEKFRNEGFSVFSTNHFRREISPFHDIQTGFALARLFRKLKIDFVHTHTSKAGFIGRIAARLSGIPYILHTVHGFAFHEFSSKKSIFFYSALERVATLFCDRVIFVNQKDRDWAFRLKIGPEQKFRVAYNGIDVQKIDCLKQSPGQASSLRQELGLAPDTILLSFTGRLSTQKNPGLLIDVLSLLPPNFVILLIGDCLGQYRDVLQAQVKQLDLGKRVIFMGFRSDVIPLIKATDIFVLPSLWEGLSISLLEAMAAGLPVVATDIKGNNEMIQSGKNGLLFRPQDKQDFADKILSLIDNQGKINSYAQQLAQAGKTTVKTKFSAENFLAKNLQVYDELINAKSDLSAPELFSAEHKKYSVKRTFDLAVATPSFLITLPILLIIGIAVKLNSRGPLIFRQIRAGKDGKPFTLLKFRTMKHLCPDWRNHDGSTYNSATDPRLTKIGKFLRNFSLDELPELWNVIKGDMSMVGPRPDVIDQLRFYSNDDLRRLRVFPGITGLAQISGRNLIPWTKRKELDFKYVDCLRQSTGCFKQLWLDLAIVLRTIPVVLYRKGIFIKSPPLNTKHLITKTEKIAMTGVRKKQVEKILETAIQQREELTTSKF
jgi:lipopolysaccharide/colanic/teichoic acid biosynthesis glycosyltransferase/glycosyltransferase involved in cell wall biosynthesis